MRFYNYLKEHGFEFKQDIFLPEDGRNKYREKAAFGNYGKKGKKKTSPHCSDVWSVDEWRDYFSNIAKSNKE